MEDIVIVGAGPAGLALCAELFRRGHRPRVFDARAERAGTSRAAVVHARTLEVMEPLGVVPDLLDDGLKVPVFRIRDRDAVLAEIGFQQIPSRYNYTLMCPQNVTEARLLARLTALGGQVERPVEAVDLQAAADRVRLDLRGPDGDRSLDARWLVGCDGGHSLVRQKAGIAFEGAAYAQCFVLADVQMDWPVERGEVSLFLSPEGLMVVAPLPGDRFRIVATVDTAPEDPPAGFFEDLLRKRGPDGSGAIRHAVWTSRFHVQHRLAPSPRRGRVLLCGDAAHVHSPAGGQGMNTGIQDAIALAAALDGVLRGAPEEALDGWARERHAVAKRVVATTDRLTRAATMKNPVARTLRNTAITHLLRLPKLRDDLARRLAELET